MCRHVAYLGAPVRLGAVIWDPPHALLRQSWAPRRQRFGAVNADGFGVGWYAEGDPVPARHRGDRPIWADPTVSDLARAVRTRALLAAVRSATRGMPGGAAAAAPFTAGRYLFSHNGKIADWPDCVTALAAGLPAAELVRMDAPTDSVLLWTLVRHHLDRGVALVDALARVVDRVASVAGGRLNLLATDGTAIAATTFGDTLSWRADPIGVVVASEPFDDATGWVDVPDRSLLFATPGGVTVAPLPAQPAEVL